MDEADRAIVRGARTTGRGRAVVVSAVLAVVGFVAFCLSISVGDFPIPVANVPGALVGLGDPGAVFVVQELRLPRALVALLVGVAFGLSGVIFQSLAHNPLASPDIIGITSGASAAAVVVIVVMHGSGSAVSAGALIGATLTALAIYVLAWKRGVSPYRLVLVGIGITAVLNAGISYLMTRAEITEAAQATVWLTGSINGRDWGHAGPLAWSLLVLVPITLLLARPLRALQLGEETARGLGVPVERSRAALVLTGVALAAVATAAAGPVAFVAFMAAPVARRLVRAPLTMIPAALVGALVVLAADTAGRRVFAPVELPVGVVTGIIGAPYLIWLLVRANKLGTGG
ncbi:iron ABC transporter [Jiangella anatolica]|uniref:Iron ABC transporter n=1 Tax=Jiangella anatolica TaxID=2670374 RepID=A0A2W2CDX2_9ACTN|nr:iron ABC transporter [Jiangella anatolica]